MKERPWRAVVFDLDDTLYPEVEYVRSGFREVARWSSASLGLDLDSVYHELTNLFQTGFRKNTFDVWIERRGLSPDLVEQMLAAYRAHSPQLEPFPGVREMLKELRAEFLLGLLSDGDLDVQERKLAALNLKEKFDAVVFSDVLGREFWKPSPKPYHFLLNALGVSPSEAIYVADNPGKDFVACRQIGMWSLWLRQPVGIYADVLPPSPEHEPHCTVSSIAELETILRRTPVYS